MIIEPTRIRIIVPVRPLLPEKTKVEVIRMQKEFYGDPNVEDNDKDYLAWQASRKSQGLPLSKHPLDYVFDRSSGMAGNHFPVDITLALNKYAFEDDKTTKLRYLTLEEAETRFFQQNLLYNKFYEALKTRRFTANKDLAVKLVQNKLTFTGYKKMGGEEKSPFVEVEDSVESCILQSNECDFTVYKTLEAEKCKGKSRLSFYLTPSARPWKKEGRIYRFWQTAEVALLYEMATNNRADYPQGQDAEKLFKLSKCQYPPDLTMAMIADYLAQDIQFYEPNGEPAEWWISFIARLKRLEPPRLWDPEDPKCVSEGRDREFFGGSTNWWLYRWGWPPHFDEESKQFWDPASALGPGL